MPPSVARTAECYQPGEEALTAPKVRGMGRLYYRRSARRVSLGRTRCPGSIGIGPNTADSFAMENRSAISGIDEHTSTGSRTIEGERTFGRI